MPLKKQINPFKAIPSPHPFDVKKFMGTLDRAGPQEGLDKLSDPLWLWLD